MVIGYDGSRAFIKNRTGTENYSYQILYHFSKLDHTNNYYIYLRPGCHPDKSPNVIARNEMTKQSIYRSPHSARDDNSSQNLQGWPMNFKFITIPYPRLWTQVGLAKQTFVDKLDVLFIPAHTLPIIHRPGLKTVVTVHDLGAEYLPATHQLKQRFYLNLMTHHQLKSATHLIAVSQATKNDLVKKVGLNPNKISVVYEGFEKELFKPVLDDKLHHTLSQYNLRYQKYFLFVGTIQPRKNLVRLIKAYALFLDQRGVTANGAVCRQDPEPPVLVLAGGKGWLSDEIYTLPAKLGIQNQVKFLGYVPDEKLPALYSGALAFVFPSLFEGFGLPILEAMACGCPVITSNVSSMPEVAGKAAILVDPYRERDITDALIKIDGSKKIREELINNGLQQIKNFSWKRAAQQTLAVLSSMH